MGKQERRMTESAPVVTHVQSAGQFLKALPPNPGCRLGLESREGFRVKG